jgi:hypothetical protein
MVSKENFRPIVKSVIDNLEGGYYNPAWHSVGDPRYGSSGETMYGIDRVAGGSINTTPTGQKFWSLIDANKSQGVWKWNYQPPEPLRSQLKELAGEIMYGPFSKNWDNYIKSDTSAIIEKDPRLIFHFAYATWNGPGWFKKFAGDMNGAVASGVKDSNKLAQVAIDSRTKEGLRPGSAPNSLIAQGGQKVASLFSTMKTSVKAHKKPIIIVIVVLMVLAIVLLIYRKKIAEALT